MFTYKYYSCRKGLKHNAIVLGKYINKTLSYKSIQAKEFETIKWYKIFIITIENL